MPARQALVIAGHGSHYSPDSARPTFEHADAIRDRDAFAEVREAFWKEEPSLREVLRTVESPEVFVVPAFVSEGYFVGEVLPRELGLGDGDASDPYGTYENVGRRDATVHYTEPFGTHDAMTDVVVERAHEAIRGLAGADVGLAVVGHGTERNPHSAEAIHYHADRIRERGTFGEVRALFMDEPPYVADATDRFETDDVVAVPLFVADGFHTREEIPELLGLDRDGDGYRSPSTVDGHRIWYSGAIGTHPGVADAIVERALDAGGTLDSPRARPPVNERTASEDAATTGAVSDATAESVAFEARRAFLGWLANDDGGEPDESTTRTWGELAITTVACDDRRYELRHVEDRGRDPADLDSLPDPRAVRDRIRSDDEGAYRPLKGAPTLPTGWRCGDLDARDLVHAIEFVYPASIENWHLEREGRLDATHFRETADRQTGIYEVVADLDSDELEAAVEACCADGACVKRRAWDEADGEPIPVERGGDEIPCREPCSLFVAAARAFVRAERDGAEGPDAPDPGVRVGNVDHEANPYRVRYRQARHRDDDRSTPLASVGGEPR